MPNKKIKKLRYNTSTFAKLSALFLIMLTIGSCSLANELSTEIKQNIETIEAANKKAYLPDTPFPSDTVVMKDGIWLGEESKKNSSALIPEELELDQGIVLISNSDVSPKEVFKKITELTGIKVMMDDMMQSAGAPASQKMALSYTGPLSGLLDNLGSHLSLWWKYKNGLIIFYDQETRIFTLYSLPSTSDFSASVSSGTGSSGSGSINSEMELDIWQELEDTVETIVPEGTEIVFSKTSGTITVTANPLTLRRVASYIQQINERISRQVAIGVKVLRVSLDKEDNYGLDLNAIFDETAGLTMTGLHGPYSTPNGEGTVNFSVVNAEDPILSKWNGSTAIIDAISTQGDVSILTSTVVTTLNNKIAPVEVANIRHYVRSISTTISDGTPTTSAETAELSTGFSMQVIPRILEHGRVMLSISMSLNQFIKMTEVNVTGSTVQLPETNTRSFLQEIAMRSGQTLVISGFEETENRVDQSGIGHPDNLLLGGKRDANKKREVLVLLVTPEVLVSPLDKETRTTRF
ncbi:MAG: PilN family type IVB pilus formation outer membrane protein [Alphaproteobacteria bacterium]|nr:PilN family type IVB pilus formation outer membrane protein [Alphaproteobacteria bacterium]